MIRVSDDGDEYARSSAEAGRPLSPVDIAVIWSL